MAVSKFIRRFYLPLPESDLEELASSLKATLEVTGFTRPRAIFRFKSGWRVDLRYRNENDKKITRFSAPMRPHGFQFSIAQQGFWKNLSRKFSKNPSELKLPWLGKDMAAFTNEPALLEELLTNEQIRSLLKDERQFSFGLQPVSRAREVNGLPAIYSMLVYEIKDYQDYPSRLRKIIAFFLVMLQLLAKQQAVQPLIGSTKQIEENE